MRKTFATLALTALAATPALAAPAADDVLAANKSATAGAAWDGKATFEVEYAYSGQGLTGNASSREDLTHGAFIDKYAIGPNTGATGWDGATAWQMEPSGTVTEQAGGDIIPLANNEAYRDQNLWWRSDHGGAVVAGDGQKTDKVATFDVLTVTPRGGKPFDAWFDARTHLLTRIVEVQGTLPITTSFSDYAPVDGVQVARTQVIDDTSGPSGLQTLTVTHAAFLGELPLSTYGRPAEHLDDYAIAGGAHETTVPFQLVNNHIYADVSVNGGAPRLFIFDTGGQSILTPDTASALSVASQGHETSTGGGNSVAQSGVSTVKSLSVGGATISNQPVSVMSLGPSGVEGVSEEGMIGYEFFDRFITRFDYGNRTITFIDKKYFDPKDAGTAVPIRFYHQIPEVLGSFDGIPARFGIDTGSRMTLMLTKPFAAEHNIRAGVKTGVEAVIGWGVGGESRGFVFRGGVLKLGDVVIDNPLTAVSTDKGGGGAAEAFPNNVGGGVLKRFVVTLDYDHATMYLKPVEGPVADLDTFDRAGLWINSDPDGFKVIDLTAHAPAEKAGLKAGDIITAVDGNPADTIALTDLRARLRDDAPGTVVVFSVRRGATTKNVRVRLRDLI